MENAGIFYAHLEYITTTWYTFGNCIIFGIFPPVLVHCVKKYLATLLRCCGKKCNVLVR
jgi:hypothetical protein